MAEEQGGEQIGRLFVEVGGTLAPLDEVLAKGKSKLEAFIAKEYVAKVGVSFENTGGAGSRPQGLVDRHGKQIGAAIGQAALGEIETKIGKVQVKDVRVEAKPKIDKDTLVAGIQGSLNGHAFKLTIDQNFLREQIQGAFGNVQVKGAAGAAAAPPTRGGLTEGQRSELDARFNALKYSDIGGQKASFGTALEGLNRTLHTILGTQPSGKGPTAALEDVISLLGDNVDEWSKKIAQVLPDEDQLVPIFESLTKKFTPKGQLYQDFFSARQQAPQPVAQPQGQAAFMAQAAQTIARAIHEEAPEAATEETRRRRGTLADPLFRGKAFSADVVTQFLGKYFTPELTRVGGGKNQPDFAALANLAELRPKESGTGRAVAQGANLIGFEPESAGESARRLQRGKTVRYPEGDVVPLSIAQVLTRGVSQLRGQPASDFPQEIQERLAKIIEVAQNAAKNVPTVKPGKENRSGILALGTSLQQFAEQDVRLTETLRLIDKLRGGRFGASRQRRVEQLSGLRDALIEQGAQPVGELQPLERRIIREALRRSSRQSRQLVEAGVGLTTGELRERERQEARQRAAQQDASPFTRRITGIVDELAGTERTLDSITSIRRFVNTRYQEIKKEAQEFFGGKLPAGVGQELAAARQAVFEAFNPTGGGTAVPRSGSGRAGTTTSGFTRGESFAEQDVRARERPGATPTGVARSVLETAVSKAIGELESRFQQSASNVARSQTSPQGGVDAQTQLYVRTVRARDEAKTAEKRIQSLLAQKALAPLGLGSEFSERYKTAEKFVIGGAADAEGANDKRLQQARRRYLKLAENSPELAAARSARQETEASEAEDRARLGHLRQVRQRALDFIEKNADLGPEGIITKAGSKRGAANILPREVISEIKDALRVPESGEPNSVARALGRDFIREANKPLSGDELRKTFGGLAFVPPGPGAPGSRSGAAELGRGTLVGSGIGGGFTPGGGGPTSGGGGGFAGFPVPLPVSIVQSIPLTIMGGRGAPRAAEDAGGVASAADQAEATASTRQPKGIRYRRKPITPRDIGTTLSGGTPTNPRVFTFDPEVYEEEDRFKEAKSARTREDALTAYNARLDRQRGPGRNIDIRSRINDIADKTQSDLESQLRRAERGVPKRGFTASITDLITSRLGGEALETQFTSSGRARREATEITQLNRRRSELLAEERVLRNAGSTRGGEDPGSQRIRAIRNELDLLRPAVRRSTAIFNENVAIATKATNVLKSFTAAGVGAAASAAIGSVTFGLGLAVTGPIIQAIGQGFTEVGGSLVERLLRYPGAAAAQQTALGQATRQAPGARAEVAFAQQQLQTGLGNEQSVLIGGTLVKRAQIEAGNQAFREQLDQFRAAQRYREQNAGQLGDAALSQNVTGFLGTSIGGTPSFEETLTDLFQDVPRGRAAAQGQLDALKKAQAANPESRRLTAIIQLENQVKDLTDNLDNSNDALEFFNARAKDSGVALKAIAGGNLSDQDRQAQVDALRQSNLFRLAGQVSSGQVGLTNTTGQAITNPQQLVDLLTKIATNAPKPSPEAFLAAQEPQIRAQQYLNQRQRNFSLQQIPIQEGIELGQQPLLPASAGFAPEDAAKYKTELNGVQTIFNQITNEAAAARQEAVNFFRTAIPDPAAATQFAASLEKSAQYGQDIAKVQLGVETAQAALAAHQYSFQLFTAKRSLQDALALQGKITSGAQNLGVIERQQFDLQRQSQALSFGQSQRQINFQRAIAGLTAPGLTGEERAARIQQAKIEADFAQKQLDIQKKLFGLGGKQFQITADRNVQDLTRQIGLLSEGREVVLKTAVAQKQIQALTLLQARENKRIQTFYQSAVDATSQVMQLEAQLVAATAVGLNKVGTLVLSQFRRVYSGLIDDLQHPGQRNSLGGLSGGSSPDERSGHAAGIVGMTKGTTDLGIAGEAGGEAVAIIKNPTPFTAGGGGSTTVIIDLRGATISDDDLLKKVVSNVQGAVERGLARKGNLLGLR